MQSFIRKNREEIEDVLESYKNYENIKQSFNQIENKSLSDLFDIPISTIEQYNHNGILILMRTICKRGVLESSKNRYKDVLPLDEFIPLKKSYINASVIGTIYPDQDYIVTQHPMNHTRGDFWEMVWDLKDCSIIVNLVPPNEIAYNDLYYPLVSGQLVRFGSFFVEKIEERTIGDSIIIYNLNVYENTTESKPKSINIVHFLQWKDKDIPPSPFDFIILIDTVNDLNPKLRNSIVVHCTAGIGRSGVFVVVHKILTRLRGIVTQKYNREFLTDCVKEEILYIRKFRPGMVQTASQFVFCFIPIHIQLVKYEKIFEKMDMYSILLFLYLFQYSFFPIIDKNTCEKTLVNFGDYIYHNKKYYGKIALSVNIGYKIIHCMITVSPKGLELKGKDIIFPNFESIKERYTYLTNMISFI
jgi:protein tyrosine phosphatase